MNKYGNQLKQICDEEGISIYQLVQLSGVPDTTIRNWTNGGLMPTLENYEKVLEALGYELIIQKK